MANYIEIYRIDDATKTPVDWQTIDVEYAAFRGVPVRTDHYCDYWVQAFQWGMLAGKQFAEIGEGYKEELRKWQALENKDEDDDYETAQLETNVRMAEWFAERFKVRAWAGR